MSKLLRDNKVKWFTDNQNVVRIIKVGSRKDELQQFRTSMSIVCSHSLLTSSSIKVLIMWNASSSIVNTGPLEVLIIKLCHCNVLFFGSICSQHAI